MRVLVDAQLPPALCRWLQAQGCEAVHVTEIGLGSASDRAIADHVSAHDLILLTKDEDFLTRHPPDRYALVWLRCGNCTNQALADWLSSRWPEIERLLDTGERLIEVR